MMSGSSLLMGDSTIPGVKTHKEVLAVLPQIEKECRLMGLDYYPICLETVRYDEMAELASYGGFPVRYPHWRWGMSYEEYARGYELNQYRISEMVINNNPCYIYLMDSNTLVDQVDVICHAIGHNHVFKNNVFFQPTDTNMLNKMANHATRIRKYIAKWGYELVTTFIDHLLRIETLVDPLQAWRRKTFQQPVYRDEREYHFPERLTCKHNYMDEWVNRPEHLDKEKERISKKEAAVALDLFGGPQRDIFKYIKDHAPLKPWQQDIASMIYEESLYFAPQRATKVLNEGLASFADEYLLCERGLASLGQPVEGAGAVHYAIHKMHVLGGKYSQNPYKLGLELLRDIRERWDKGRFGEDYDNCKDMRKREKWDTKVGKGMEKVFEVIKYYNDYTLLQEFFTPDFCRKKKFFEYRRMNTGEWKITNDGSTPEKFKSIKDKIIQRHLNGGLPDIRLEDPNHLGRGWLLLQHYWCGQPLHDVYARETLTSIRHLWGRTAVLATRNRDGDELVYVCHGTDPDKGVNLMVRREYEKEFMR